MLSIHGLHLPTQITDNNDKNAASTSPRSRSQLLQQRQVEIKNSGTKWQAALDQKGSNKSLNRTHIGDEAIKALLQHKKELFLKKKKESEVDPYASSFHGEIPTGVKIVPGKSGGGLCQTHFHSECSKKCFPEKRNVDHQQPTSKNTNTNAPHSTIAANLKQAAAVVTNSNLEGGGNAARGSSNRTKGRDSSCATMQKQPRPQTARCSTNSWEEKNNLLDCLPDYKRHHQGIPDPIGRATNVHGIPQPPCLSLHNLFIYRPDYPSTNDSYNVPVYSGFSLNHRFNPYFDDAMRSRREKLQKEKVAKSKEKENKDGGGPRYYRERQIVVKNFQMDLQKELDDVKRVKYHLHQQRQQYLRDTHDNYYEEDELEQLRSSSILSMASSSQQRNTTPRQEGKNRDAGGNVPPPEKALWGVKPRRPSTARVSTQGSGKSQRQGWTSVYLHPSLQIPAYDPHQDILMNQQLVQAAASSSKSKTTPISDNIKNNDSLQKYPVDVVLADAATLGNTKRGNSPKTMRYASIDAGDQRRRSTTSPITDVVEDPPRQGDAAVVHLRQPMQRRPHTAGVGKLQQQVGDDHHHHDDGAPRTIEEEDPALLTSTQQYQEVNPILSASIEGGGNFQKVEEEGEGMKKNNSNVVVEATPFHKQPHRPHTAKPLSSASGALNLGGGIRQIPSYSLMALLEGGGNAARPSASASRTQSIENDFFGFLSVKNKNSKNNKNEAENAATKHHQEEGSISTQDVTGETPSTM